MAIIVQGIQGPPGPKGDDGADGADGGTGSGGRDTVTPIWEDANETYTPGQPSTWEDLDGDVPETKREALDTIIGLIADLSAATGGTSILEVQVFS